MIKSMCEFILAVIAIVIGIWQLTVNNWNGISAWVLLVIGVVLLIHCFICKKCFGKKMDMPKRGRR